MKIPLSIIEPFGYFSIPPIHPMKKHDTMVNSLSHFFHENMKDDGSRFREDAIPLLIRYALDLGFEECEVNVREIEKKSKKHKIIRVGCTFQGLRYFKFFPVTP